MYFEDDVSDLKRFLQNDYDKSDEASAKVAEENVKRFEEIIAKSDVSRQMQELLGTYLLFER